MTSLPPSVSAHHGYAALSAVAANCVLTWSSCFSWLILLASIPTRRCGGSGDRNGHVPVVLSERQRRNGPRALPGFLGGWVVICYAPNSGQTPASPPRTSVRSRSWVCGPAPHARPDPPCHRLAGEVQGEREFVGGGRSAPEKIPAMPSVMPVGQFIRSLTCKFFGTLDPVIRRSTIQCEPDARFRDHAQRGSRAPKCVA